MTGVVVDASAVGSIFLADEDQSLGRLALAMWSEQALRAPSHWPVEVVSILVKAERVGRISADQCLRAWTHARAMIEACGVDTASASAAVFELAHATGLSAQDAGYVELAARHELPLLTGDKAMARVARSLGVALVFEPK